LGEQADFGLSYHRGENNIADLCVTKVRKGYPGRRGNVKVTYDYRKFYADPLRFVLYAFDWGEGDLVGWDGPDKWQRAALKDPRCDQRPQARRCHQARGEDRQGSGQDRAWKHG
jgi:hypothetical protein